MKNKPKQTLALRAEIIKQLTDTELKVVATGSPPTGSWIGKGCTSTDP